MWQRSIVTPRPFPNVWTPSTSGIRRLCTCSTAFLRAGESTPPPSLGTTTHHLIKPSPHPATSLLLPQAWESGVLAWPTHCPPFHHIPPARQLAHVCASTRSVCNKSSASAAPSVGSAQGSASGKVGSASGKV